MQNYSPDADSLMAVLRRLRAPDGCPWDRKQTRASLSRHLAGECGELIDAIDCNDPAHICEELGDVLMNLLFQVVIAEENGEFTLTDVWREIIAKMIRRHAHVFGDAKAETAEDVAGLWAEIKRRERAEEAVPESILDSVKHSLSALERAEKLQKKAAEVNFDWQQSCDIAAKIREELAEYEAAVAAGDEVHADEELGDLLFAVTNLVRFRKRANSEELLRAASRKFERRFRAMEKKLAASNITLETAGFAELDRLWSEVKSEEESSAPAESAVE